MTLKAQEKAIQQQPDIVVATPGRILDLLLNSPVRCPPVVSALLWERNKRVSLT